MCARPAARGAPVRDRLAYPSFPPPPQVDAAKVTPSAHLTNDLGLDSLDAVEVCMALEEEFVVTIPDAEAEKILSVEDAVAFIVTHPQAK